MKKLSITMIQLIIATISLTKNLNIHFFLAVKRLAFEQLLNSKAPQTLESQSLFQKRLH